MCTDDNIKKSGLLAVLTQQMCGYSTVNASGS